MLVWTSGTGVGRLTLLDAVPRADSHFMGLQKAGQLALVREFYYRCAFRDETVDRLWRAIDAGSNTRRCRFD